MVAKRKLILLAEKGLTPIVTVLTNNDSLAVFSLAFPLGVKVEAGLKASGGFNHAQYTFDFNELKKFYRFAKTTLAESELANNVANTARAGKTVVEQTASANNPPKEINLLMPQIQSGSIAIDVVHYLIYFAGVSVVIFILCGVGYLIVRFVRDTWFPDYQFPTFQLKNINIISVGISFVVAWSGYSVLTTAVLPLMAAHAANLSFVNGKNSLLRANSFIYSNALLASKAFLQASPLFQDSLRVVAQSAAFGLIFLLCLHETNKLLTEEAKPKTES